MGFDTISAKQICNYVGKYNTIIIDLRDKTEYDCGHIPTAVNIPFKSLSKYKYKISMFHEVILYCDRGSMSLLAARELNKMGYQVINIYGGINAYRGEIEMKGNYLSILD